MRCPACNDTMMPRREGGFSCKPCRQVIILFRVENNLYLGTTAQQEPAPLEEIEPATMFVVGCPMVDCLIGMQGRAP
jgi:hypothetical protein